MVKSESKELPVECLFYAYPLCQEHLKAQNRASTKIFFLFKKIYGMMLAETWPE